MSDAYPATPKRRGRLLRFGAAFVVLCAVAGYVVVQYLTAGTAAPGCKVVSGRGDGASYEFTPEQAVNAATIAAVGTARGLPERAVTIALATALQESGLRNIEHGDRDSLGLFQQRPSQGWGTEQQIMDPAYAAGVFYQHLAKVPDYTDLPLTVAAQRVQLSGYPEAYAKHEPDATLLAASLTGAAPATLTCQGRPVTSTEAAGIATPTAAATAAATVTGPDAVRAALVRDFGRDALQETGAEVGGTAAARPKPTPSVTAQTDGRTVTVPVPEGAVTDASGRTEEERGWQLAHWAVANSSALHIRRVAYAGHEWAAGSADSQWHTASAQGGDSVDNTNSVDGTGNADSSAGVVRIVTGQ